MVKLNDLIQKGTAHMDTITLRRALKSETVARLYTMTGGAFTEMKDAIKTCGASFDGLTKTWLVKKDDLNTLTTAGYAVTAIAPFRHHQTSYFQQTARGDGTSDISATVSFEYVSDLAGHWMACPVYGRIQFKTQTAGTDHNTIQHMVDERAQAIVKVAVEQFSATWDGKYTTESVIDAIKQAIQ